MVSERLRRQVERLLDEAEAAMSASQWTEAAEKARAALAIEPENPDAPALLRAAQTNLSPPPSESKSAPGSRIVSTPSSFAGGRYEVRRFLGEGGKKRVFLAHDTRLDRDVAFALIKTDGGTDSRLARVSTQEGSA